MSSKAYRPGAFPPPADSEGCDFCGAELLASQLTVIAFPSFGTCGQACEPCLRRPLVDFAYIRLQAQQYR